MNYIIVDGHIVGIANNNYDELSAHPSINNTILDIAKNYSSDDLNIIKVCTKADYDAMASHNPNTVYYVYTDIPFPVVDSINYLDVANKPSINNIILTGNKSLRSLDIYSIPEVDNMMASMRSIKVVPTKPAIADVVANTLYYVGTAAPYQVYLYDSNKTEAPLGTSEVDLSAYVKKDDIATTLDANSTNTQVAGAKAVYDNFAPINANCVRISNGVSNIDRAIFDFSNQNTSTGARQVESRYFMQVSLQDPITTSDTMYGYVITEQSLVSAYQVRIIQNFTSTFHNGGSGLEGKTQKVFRRVGVITSSDVNIIYKPLTNSSSITWYPWYPIEYPAINIARDTTNTSSGFIEAIVSGGTLKIEIDAMKLNSAPGTGSVKVATLPTRLRTALKSWSRQLGYYRGFAFSIASTPHSGLIQIINNTGDITVFGNFNADEAFWASITAQLGY